jgi:hypothetical protein
MRRALLLAALVCFVAGTAAAQTKASGTLTYGKPEQEQMIPTGVGEGHAIGVSQRKGTWSKPLDIGGDKSKEGMSTESIDVSGSHARSHGVHVTTMESGDKLFVAFQGSDVLKDNALVSGKGTWSYTGGTGKLKGITGKGTYTCKTQGESVSCDVEGEYQLAK